MLMINAARNLLRDNSMILMLGRWRVAFKLLGPFYVMICQIKKLSAVSKHTKCIVALQYYLSNINT